MKDEGRSLRWKENDLIHTVGDGMSWVVLDPGEGSFPNSGCSNNVGDNWGRVSLDNWAGISVGNWTGISVSNWAGVGISVVSVVSVNVGVSKSVGGWDNSGGENLTLLPSRTGQGLLVGDGMGSSGLDHLRSLLNWSWADEVADMWVGDWSEGKVIAGHTEAIVSGGVCNADFLSVGVDVGVGSTDISGSVTNFGLGLSRVGISVGSLAKFILSVVLGLVGKRSNNLVSDGWNMVDSVVAKGGSPNPIVQENLGVGAGSGHNSGENANMCSGVST